MRRIVDETSNGTDAWGNRIHVVWRDHSMLFHELAHHLQALETPGQRHDEPEIVRRGKELHRDSFRRRHPVALMAYKGIYRSLDPFVRPWLLHRPAYDPAQSRRRLRRWLVRWSLGATGGAVLGAVGYGMGDEAIGGVLRVTAVPLLAISLLGLLFLVPGYLGMRSRVASGDR